MFNRRLSSFVPSVYDGVVEMDDIINTEDKVMDIARAELSAAFANTFVLTSDESGVIMFEKMLNITANVQTEDLESRRHRILNRLSMSPPFTFSFLKQKLDEIIGPGAWAAYIDFDNYTIYIESSAIDQNWYSEVEFTINRIKPCNMVFINVPYTAPTVSISEEISYKQRTWRYRLSSWRLGQYPFATLDEGGTVKMAETKSIQQALLNDAAAFVASDIAYVVLNNTIILNKFTLKQVAENMVTIEYEVTPNLTKLITSIKLMRSDSTTLTQAAVYVPVTQPIISKHLITVKEGA
jgi:hypothetical protein